MHAPRPDPLDRIEAVLRGASARRARGAARRAAVAVALAPGPELLFIRRVERRGDPWSGHVAFPGGRAEPGDADDRATAERETAEEVGIDLAREGRWIAALDELTTPPLSGPRRLVVAPQVYRLGRRPPVAIGDEVAEARWIALSRLLSGEGRGRRPWRVAGVGVSLPAVRLDGLEIWGLTLRIVDDLLRRLRAAGLTAR